MDLDFWDCFGRKNLCLIAKKYGTLSLWLMVYLQILHDAWLLTICPQKWLWEEVTVKNTEFAVPQTWCHQSCKVRTSTTQFICIRDSLFFLQNNSKNLKPSNKMVLDFWDCFGRGKTGFLASLNKQDWTTETMSLSFDHLVSASQVSK